MLAGKAQTEQVNTAHAVKELHTPAEVPGDGDGDSLAHEKVMLAGC
jgi:hypothetical protein